MKVALINVLALLLCKYVSAIEFGQSSPVNKILSRLPKFIRDKAIPVAEDEEDDDDDDDDEDDISVSKLGALKNAIFSRKVFNAIKTITKVSVAVGVSYVVGLHATKFIRKVLKERQEQQESQQFFNEDVTTPMSELLTNLYNKDSSGIVAQMNETNFAGKSICLLFDCEKRISSPEDIKARQDYFALMANLTAKSTDMISIYIPGGNAHFLEKKMTVAPHWPFLPSSPAGMRYLMINLI